MKIIENFVEILDNLLMKMQLKMNLRGLEFLSQKRGEMSISIFFLEFTRFSTLSENAYT